MKLIFLAATYGTIYMIVKKYKKSYNRENDQMPLYYLIVPCLVLAFIFNKKFTLWEIMWAFSIYLEAVAIFPQLVMLQTTGDVDTITYDYMFTLGGYRALYLINWIYRLATEPEYSEWIVWIAGLVQTGLYCDFFYYYLKSKWYGTKMRLPQ
jgi:ER lumen protein retaining receptor